MSTPFQIRPARAEDDHAVGELLVEAFVNTYARKMPQVVVDDARKRDLRAVAEKRKVAHVWVAELNGEVIGTVALFAPGSEGSEAWIPGGADLRHLAVSERHRGIGVSNALLDVAEAEAWKLGATVVCLHVRRGARGIATLYQSRGYLRDVKGDLDKPTVFLEAFYLPKPA